MQKTKAEIHHFWSQLSGLGKVAYISAAVYFLIGPIGFLIDTLLIVFAPTLASYKLNIITFDTWIALYILALGAALLAKRWILFAVTLVSLLPLMAILIGADYLVGYLLQTLFGIDTGVYR